jgi:hypothetical protein
MDNKQELLKKIEECRKEMVNLYGSSELSSDAMLLISVHLDNLLNRYAEIC